MSKTATPFDYKTLAVFLLPQGILDFFDVTNVFQENTGEIELTGSEKILIHIFLDERDNRPEVWHDLKPNGFTEERLLNDFPIRDHKVILHVRRRRWLTEEGTNKVLKVYDLIEDKTNYSKEFAVCLKKIFGYIPSDGPLSGAIL